ncbi:MAG TPA: hypothetical protein VFC66_05485 [Anaerolineaceae bacterium]|nr:hypothetical protein [Anaerolineaceae bacterium]
MERTVPIRSSEEIDLYLRTIYSLLRSTNEVYIRTLEGVHAGTGSSLHMSALGDQPDTSALIYTLLRLPEVITRVNKVILGQSATSFGELGYSDVESWQEVSAKARRRKCFYDGDETLACYIASRSDIDDVVPCLTALQIEWNKLHFFLNTIDAGLLDEALPGNPKAFSQLGMQLHLSEDDIARLYTVLGDQFTQTLKIFRARKADFTIQLLSGSLNDYRRATVNWWNNIEEQATQFKNRPVYFISSNPHSMTNLLSGYALGKKDSLLQYIHNNEPGLEAEWEEINRRKTPSNLENFYYYSMKKFLGTEAGQPYIDEQLRFEKERGIHRIPSRHSFDVEANIIELNKLDPATIDQRLIPTDNGSSLDFLSKSDALILNIDYPLGYAAYNLLTKIAESVSEIFGVYIMGKAASLNGVRGDVIIPEVVYDEHSQNTYIFSNNFTAKDVAAHLTFGTVLDNQKAVTVMGTFLQNKTIMDVIYREGYTDIEMEAGPYLSAVYELSRPQRYPINQIVTLNKLTFDLGIMHDVSDTPYTKGKNLGAGTLSYFGMDSTYAVSISILRRIMELEKQRLYAS